MYPNDFSNYSLEDLLRLIEQLSHIRGSYSKLSISQKKSLLARLATVRADLDQKIQDLDEAINILSSG